MSLSETGMKAYILNPGLKYVQMNLKNTKPARAALFAIEEEEIEQPIPSGHTKIADLHEDFMRLIRYTYNGELLRS